MSDVPDNEETRGPAYGYKPSLLGSGWEFRLTPSALVWAIGRSSRSVAYKDIRKVQLVFRPRTMQHGTFQTHIWSEGSPKVTISSSSWKSLVEVTPQDAPYRDFILALHRHLTGTGARIMFVRGVKPYIYWPGTVFSAATALGFAVLIVRALQTGAWAAAAFVCAFLGLFLWQVGGYFRRNRPGYYRPDDVPADLLPGG